MSTGPRSCWLIHSAANIGPARVRDSGTLLLVRSIVSAVRTAVREAGDVLSPRWCAGCQKPNTALCQECTALFFGPLIPAEVRGTDMPIWAAAHYEGEVRNVVLAWKRGRGDITPTLKAAASELVERWWVGQPFFDGPLFFIPAPSGWRRRARGLLVAAQLASWCSHAVAVLEPGAGHTSADVLRRRRSPLAPSHLAGLSRTSRAESRRNSTRVITTFWKTIGAGADVVLVDDVVTSGATLGSAAEALEKTANERGVRMTVRGALVLAATPSRSARGT